jgi:hypothetical protein
MQEPSQQFGVGFAQAAPSTHAPDGLHVWGPPVVGLQRRAPDGHAWQDPLTQSGVVPEHGRHA